MTEFSSNIRAFIATNSARRMVILLTEKVPPKQTRLAQTMNFTARFPWTKAPLLVAAPMRVMSGPDLAVAVSMAGGLGFLGPNTSTEKMDSDLQRARALRAKQQGVGQPHSSTHMPIGVGFQLWNDDLSIATQLLRNYKPAVAWLYAPKDEADYSKWLADLRKASSGTEIWIQIGTVGEVQRLISQSLIPDALVVQGSEAGGHGRAEDGMGVMSLVPEVVDLLKRHNLNVPVIAAGGITDGRGAAAALCLGAKGFAMGTRFLASTEARISKGYQQEVVRASDAGTNTTRTLLYNHLRGTFGWPKAYAPRTIVNRSFVEHEAGVSFHDLQTLHDEAATKGDEAWGPAGRVATYAGTSIGLIQSVKSAEQIVREVQKEVRSILGTLQQDLGTD